MAVQLQRQQKILLALLIVTVGLTIWLALQSDEDALQEADTVVAVEDKAKSNKAEANKISSSDLEQLSSTKLAMTKFPIFAKQAQSAKEIDQTADSGVDLFKSLQAEAKAEKKSQIKVEELQPAATEAPPLPFTYMGKVDEDDKSIYYLNKNNKLYTVHLGDKFDGQYRLDEQNGMQLEITYLPMNIQQTLSMTGVK